MRTRDALTQMGPSLTLQRAAQIELAAADAIADRLAAALESLPPDSRPPEVAAALALYEEHRRAR